MTKTLYPPAQIGKRGAVGLRQQLQCAPGVPGVDGPAELPDVAAAREPVAVGEFDDALELLSAAGVVEEQIINASLDRLLAFLDIA